MGLPLLNRAVLTFHQQRKKLHTWRARRKNANCSSDLGNFERKVFSQFGEDGLIEEILNRIGEGTKFAVEFGIETGVECNSRNLIENRGWSAVLMDGSPENIAAARRLYSGKPVRAIDCFITVENIIDLFVSAGVPTAFDLLSIDVDGNDYWLMAKVLERYSPRVLVVEYNARWVPPREWVVPYDPGFVWDFSVFFGASLQSLTNLAERHGYRLVACSNLGVNAFFVRSDLADKFPTAHRGASYHYRAPLYARGFGHPVRAPNRSDRCR